VKLSIIGSPMQGRFWNCYS